MVNALPRDSSLAINGAPVGVDDVGDKGETETGALDAQLGRAAPADKSLQDVLPLARRDAKAVVADDKRNAGFRSFQLQRNRSASR